MDLLSQRNRVLIESFLDPDTKSLLDRETETRWNEKHRQLSSALASVVRKVIIFPFVCPEITVVVEIELKWIKSSDSSVKMTEIITC